MRGSNFRICFVHVPKCGGQSIKSAVEKSYRSKLNTVRVKAAASLRASSIGHSDPMDNLFTYRENLLRYFLSDHDNGLVMGHFPCRNETIVSYPEWNFITLLRHPVDRFLSHYFYNTYKKSDHFKLEASLDEFVDSQQAEGLGRIYVTYFSGMSVTNDQALEVQQAKDTLEKFQLVGILEELNDFKKRYHSKFHRSLKISAENRSPANRRKEEQKIDSVTMRKIEQLCEPSMEIYEFIRTVNQNG